MSLGLSKKGNNRRKDKRNGADGEGKIKDHLPDPGSPGDIAADPGLYTADHVPGMQECWKHHRENYNRHAGGAPYYKVKRFENYWERPPGG